MNILYLYQDIVRLPARQRGIGVSMIAFVAFLTMVEED